MDKQGNAWRMIYRLMDNVKTSMDATMQENKKISDQDIEYIINYINNGLQNITRNTIGEK